MQTSVNAEKKWLDTVVGWIYSYRFILTICIITLASAFLRFYHIGTESLWYDETTSVYSAGKSMYIMLGGCLEWHRQPPLHFMALKIWMALFGDSETVIRTLSAVFGIASIPLIILTGRQLFNARVGLTAGFLSAVSYFFIRFSQEGRGYAMLVFFTLLSFYLFIRIINSDKPGKKLFIFYFMANTLLAYTHYFGLFIIIAQIFFFIFAGKQLNMNNRYFWKAQAATGVAFQPWAVGFILFSIPNSFSMGQPGLQELVSTLKDYSGYGTPASWLLLIFGGLCLWGLFSQATEGNPGQARNRIIKIRFFKWTIYREYSIPLLLVWLLFPIAVPFIISQVPVEITGIYGSKYTIGAMPAFILLVSRGMDKIPARNKLWPVFMVLILVITILSGGGLRNYYSTIQKEQWREAVKIIESQVQANDAIVLNQGYFSMALDYYSREKLETQAIQPGEEEQSIQQIKATGKQRMWLVQGPWGEVNTRDYMERVMDKEALLLKETLKGLEIYLYDLTSSVQ